MTSPQTRRLGCNRGVELDDRYGQTIHQVESNLDLDLAAPSRRDETLSKRGRSDRQLVVAVDRLGEYPASCGMVCVIGVEEPDDDARIDLDQSHSERS